MISQKAKANIKVFSLVLNTGEHRGASVRVQTHIAFQTCLINARVQWLAFFEFLENIAYSNTFSKTDTSIGNKVRFKRSCKGPSV